MADNSEVLTSIDIGSHTLKGVVVGFEDGDSEVLAFSKIRSRGYEQGELKDIVALREGLEEILQDLSSQLPRRMESYFIITFAEKTAFLSEEVKTIAVSQGEPGIINEDHVVELFERFNNSKSEEEEDLSEESAEGFDFVNNSRSILHVIPQKYILDEGKGVLNPIDMEANTLGMMASLISMDYTEKESISNAFAGVVGEKPLVYSSSFTSAEAILNGMEKERGVVCIDLGHSFTTVTGYLNGSVFYLKSLDQGIKQVIKDIAQVFRTSFDEAERLLNNYGKVALKDTSTESISYVMLDGKTTKQISRSQLSIVVYAKAREILNYVKKDLRKVMNRLAEEGENSIPGGIVITGGGARIDGMAEFIRDTFKLSVRVGHVGEDTGSFEIAVPEELEDPIYSAALGSVYWYRFIGGSEVEDVEASTPKKKKKKKKVSVKEKPEGPGLMDKFLTFLKKLV